MAASPVPKPPPPKPAAMPRSSPWPVIIIIFLFIILGAAAYGYVWYQSQQLLHSVTISTPPVTTTITPPDNTSSSTSSAQKNDIVQLEFTIPTNNPDDWQQVGQADQLLAHNAVYINNRSGFSDWYMKASSLTGTEFIRTTTITGNDDNTGSTNDMTYEEEVAYFENFGFSQEIEHEGYRVGPPIADSPYSSVNGYVREIHGQIQVYLYSSNALIVDSIDSPDGGPPIPQYPYELETREFLSDPISLEDLLDIAQDL
jgi:hypothetical protein